MLGAWHARTFAHAYSMCRVLDVSSPSSQPTTMSLLKYFQTKSSLPKPDGPLSKAVPSSSIVAANKEVKEVLEKPEEKDTLTPSKRGTYESFTPEEKARIGKRAAEHGVTATVRHFSRVFTNRSLKESTVRTWKMKYLQEVAARRRANEDTSVKELVNKKTGRPLMLGEDLDKQVRAYLTALRETGAVVNTAITIACAKGVVKNFDSNLLECNGGHVSLTKHWAKYLLERMGFVKRRASTKAKVSLPDFEQFKAQFVFDVKAVIEMEEIPSELVINWDQTGIHYVPVSSWTMAKEGSKRVEITGIDDKRQLTAVFAGTMAGDFLPPQLVYQGKTSKCLPSIKFPSDWHITFTENHWSNEATMVDYLEKVLVPYVERKREELKLDSNYPALVIFDRFRGQCTDDFFAKLEAHHVLVAVVPANCTDRLQPLDVSVNKAAKEFLRGQFQEWYSEQICQQLQKGCESAPHPVDLRMSIVKPLGGKWMISLYDYMKSKPDIIKNGFHHAGLTNY